jgi:hypothetical protein
LEDKVVDYNERNLPDGVHELKWYKDRLNDYVDRDHELRKMQLGIERILHVEYEPPEDIKKLPWFRTYRSTKPYDADKAGTRALSTLEEQISIHPLTVMKAVGIKENPEADAVKQMANAWERILLQQMNMAAQRKRTPKSEIVRSALRYDEIVGNLVHIPTQIKAIEAIGGDASRQRRALEFGQFSPVVYRAMDCHVTYSDYGPEEICLSRVKTAKELLSFWGERLGDLKEAIEDGSVELSQKFVEHDWNGHDSRCVWVFQGSSHRTLEARLSISDLVGGHRRDGTRREGRVQAPASADGSLSLGAVDLDQHRRVVDAV